MDKTRIKRPVKNELYNDIDYEEKTRIRYGWCQRTK